MCTFHVFHFFCVLLFNLKSETSQRFFRSGRRTRRTARQRTYRKRCGFVWDIKSVFDEIFFISNSMKYQTYTNRRLWFGTKSHRIDAGDLPTARHVAKKTRFPSGKRFRPENCGGTKCGNSAPEYILGPRDLFRSIRFLGGNG